MGNPDKYLDIEPVFNDKGVPVPPFTDSDAANRLVGRDANALLIGIVLDQQISSTKAFAGPYELKRRLGHLNPRKIAAMPEDQFLAAMSRKPAIHRFPNSMGKRVQQACQVLVDDYKGNAANITQMLVGGLKSGAGYAGCRSIKELQKKAKFIKITAPGIRESHVHDVIITKEAPNYHLD